MSSPSSMTFAGGSTATSPTRALNFSRVPCDARSHARSRLRSSLPSPSPSPRLAHRLRFFDLAAQPDVLDFKSALVGLQLINSGVQGAISPLLAGPMSSRVSSAAAVRRGHRLRRNWCQAASMHFEASGGDADGRGDVFA